MKMKCLLLLNYLLVFCKSEDPMIFTSVGVALVPEDLVNLYNYKLAVEWTYVTPSPCHLSYAQRNAIFSKCFINVTEARYLDVFVTECQKLWTSELETIHDVIDEHEYKPIKDFNRKPRKVRRQAIAAAVGIFGSLAFGFVNHREIEHLKVRFEDFDYENKVFIENTKNYLYKIGTLANNNARNINILSENVCSIVSETRNSIRRILLINHLHWAINNLNNEALALSNGALPSNIYLYQQVVKLCIKMQVRPVSYADKIQFCKQVVRGSDNLDLKFDGISIIESSANMFMSLKIPIWNSDIDISKVYQIANVGYYKNNRMYQLEMPEYVIKLNVENSDFNNFVSIDKSTCSHNLCPIKGIYFNSGSECLQALIENNNVTSCYAHEISEQFCSVSQTRMGTLVSARNADYIPNDQFDPIKLKKTTKFLTSSGKLICNMHTISSTVMIENGHKAHKTYTRQDFEVKIPSNFHAYLPILSNISDTANIRKDIQQMSWDHVNISKVSFPISYIFIGFLLMMFIAYVIFQNRVYLIKLLCIPTIKYTVTQPPRLSSHDDILEEYPTMPKPMARFIRPISNIYPSISRSFRGFRHGTLKPDSKNPKEENNCEKDGNSITHIQI